MHRVIELTRFLALSSKEAVLQSDRMNGHQIHLEFYLKGRFDLTLGLHIVCR